MRRRRVILKGPVLLGFATMFDRAHGDPRTPRPYPRVTPTRMGAALLPFPCPHCGEVKPEVVHPRRLGWYSDVGRGFQWCPGCRGRYVVNYKGAPPAAAVEPGAGAAPAIVERGGARRVISPRSRSGLDLLGACRVA